MSDRFQPLRTQREIDRERLRIRDIAALALIVFLAVTIVDAALRTAVWLATEYVR